MHPEPPTLRGDTRGPQRTPSRKGPLQVCPGSNSIVRERLHSSGSLLTCEMGNQSLSPPEGEVMRTQSGALRQGARLLGSLSLTAA